MPCCGRFRVHDMHRPKTTFFSAVFYIKPSTSIFSMLKFEYTSFTLILVALLVYFLLIYNATWLQNMVNDGFVTYLGHLVSFMSYPRLSKTNMTLFCKMRLNSFVPLQILFKNLFQALSSRPHSSSGISGCQYYFTPYRFLLCNAALNAPLTPLYLW